MKKGDVATLRHNLAAESRTFADGATDPAEKFIRLWESYCYEPDRIVKARIPEVERQCLKALSAGTGDMGDPRKFFAFKRFVKMLVADGWLKSDSEIEKALDAMREPPKPTAPNMRDF